MVVGESTADVVGCESCGTRVVGHGHRVVRSATHPTLLIAGVVDLDRHRLIEDLCVGLAPYDLRDGADAPASSATAANRYAWPSS